MTILSCSTLEARQFWKIRQDDKTADKLGGCAHGRNTLGALSHLARDRAKPGRGEVELGEVRLAKQKEFKMPPIGKDLMTIDKCSSDAALSFLRKFKHNLAETGRYNLQDVRLVGIIAENYTISRMTIRENMQEMELTDRRRQLLNSLINKAIRKARSCDEIMLAPAIVHDFDWL